MFVLSVGFLMAQDRLTYQAVVEDEQGNLVVNQDVNATVTIRFAGSTTTYNPEIYPEIVHTSLNGMAMFYIFLDDIPADVDWKTAEIKVQFSPVAAGVTVPTAEFEKAAGVPYALQAGGDDALTTEMIADYYSRPTTTMEDMQAIFDALERNEWLSEDLKWAFVDTVVNNRQVAKQILLHYLNTGTPDDVQALYNAYDGNEGLKTAIKEILKQLITENREVVYDILSAYTVQLTPAEVTSLFNVVPAEVMNRAFFRAVEYIKDVDQTYNTKGNLIMPIFMDYVTNITVAEFDELVQTIIDNEPVYQVMLAKFNQWMDEYFQNHYTGGSNVEELVAGIIEEGYFAQCEDEPVDLCQLKADIESLLPTSCFVTNPSEPEFVNNLDDGKFEAEFTYSGTASIWQAEETMYVSVNGGTEFELSSADYVTLSSGIINVEIPWSAFNIPGEDITSLEVQVDLFATCGDEEDYYSVTITWAE